MTPPTFSEATEYLTDDNHMQEDWVQETEFPAEDRAKANDKIRKMRKEIDELRQTDIVLQRSIEQDEIDGLRQRLREAYKERDALLTEIVDFDQQRQANATLTQQVQTLAFSNESLRAELRLHKDYLEVLKGLAK